MKTKLPMVLNPKITLTLFTLLLGIAASAQVGIRNSTPNSLFDIEASSPLSPSNTDGLLIPRISVFPSSDPTSEQDGMLVFLSTANGNYKKGFHYWADDSKTWTPYGGEWVDGYNGDLEKLVYAKQANANGVDVVFIDTGGLGMGTDNPMENLEIKFPGENGIQISSTKPPNAPNIIWYTKDGTFSSPNRLEDSEYIGAITGSAYSGSGRSDVIASIISSADGDHGSGDLATKFELSVTGNGNESADTDGSEMVIRASGNIGFGVDNPTAVLQIQAGNDTAEGAPLKFNSGTNLTTPETGALEYDGTHLYFTPNSERKILLKGLSATATLDFPNITSKGSAELTVTVPNAATGSSCNCAPRSAVENGLKWSCYISASNTATIRLSNITSSAINPVSRDWKVNAIE